MIVAVSLALLANAKLNAKYWFDRKKQKILQCKNLLSHTKMGKEILPFGDIEIENNKI